MIKCIFRMLLFLGDYFTLRRSCLFVSSFLQLCIIGSGCEGVCRRYTKDAREMGFFFSFYLIFVTASYYHAFWQGLFFSFWVFLFFYFCNKILLDATQSQQIVSCASHPVLIVWCDTQSAGENFIRALQL